MKIIKIRLGEVPEVDPTVAAAAAFLAGDSQNPQGAVAPSRSPSTAVPGVATAQDLVNPSTGGDAKVTNENMLAIQGLIASNPALAKTPEISELLRLYNEENPTTSTTSTTSTVPTGGEEAFVNHSNDNPFLGKVSSFDFENVTEKDLGKVANNVFNIDPSKEGWAKEFTEGIVGYKESVDKLITTQNSLEEIKTAISNLPTPLLKAVSSAMNNGDWRVEMSNADIDYTKNWDEFSEADQISAARKYHPNIVVTEEDIVAKDHKVTSLLGLGKSSFEINKQKIQASVDERKTKMQGIDKQYDDSVTRTIGNLTSKYSSFDAQSLSDIEKLLKEEGTRTLFFESDGITLKKNAAERVALALYGDRLLSSEVGKASAQSASNAVTDIIGRNQSRGVAPTAKKDDGNKDERIESLGQMLGTYQNTY